MLLEPLFAALATNGSNSLRQLIGSKFTNSSKSTNYPNSERRFIDEDLTEVPTAADLLRS
jgi:hypothetical protein